MVLSARTRAKLAEVQEEIERLSSAVQVMECDVREEQAVAETVEAIERDLGPVSVLINNAGISPFSTFSETTADEFRAVMETNILGMFHAAKAVLPGMYARNRGTIVQMLSIASRKAFRGGAAYVASKFAALGMTEALREEARKHGVKVIGVLPGATETDVWDASAREEFHERMMQPEDIARAIARILLEPERMMTEELVLRPIGGDL